MSPTDYNSKEIRILKISESLRNENIVKLFAADNRCIHATLIHVYNDVVIISDIDKKSWQKTVKNFRDAAEKKGIEQRHIDMLDNTLADNYQTIDEIGRVNSLDDSSNGSEKENQKYVYPTYKYSRDRKDALHEAVIISGLPHFVKYDKENGKLEIVEKIEEPSRILRPPNIDEYPYIPYEFANPEELEYYYNMARNESIYSIYLKWKSIVKNYNDQDDYILNLISIDLLWSYFQDLFPTTHYIAAIGDNGSGKSSIGETLEYGGYRCVNLTNPSAPNVFRVLGTIESGQCTLILDEVDNIEEHSEMQSILKTGNRNGKRVSKTNTNTWKPEYFYTYCMKIFLAERSPNQWKSKGVLDRTFVFNSFVGMPSNLIEETTDPQGDPERQRLLDELNDLRKLTLVYRIIHFGDPIPDIDIGVTGRNLQLSKPYIQLFYNTPAQKEVEETLQKFLDMKNEKKANSLEAMLLPTIRRLLSEETRKSDGRIRVSRIWERIRIDLDAEGSIKDPDMCYTDYGKLYRTTITGLIRDKFGAKPTRMHGGTRALDFDLNKFSKIEKAYGAQTKIRTTLKVKHRYGDTVDSDDSSRETPTPINDKNDSPSEDDHGRIYENIDNMPDNSENITEGSHEPVPETLEKGYSVSQEPSLSSPLSPETFWMVYNRLEEKELQNPSNVMEIDKNTVNEDELLVALYDTGQCSKVEGEEFIDNLLQSNELEMVSFGTYRRRT